MKDKALEIPQISQGVVRQRRQGPVSWVIAAATAATLALASQAALAQATQTTPADKTAATQTGGLEEVVVTARYREEKLQQTPIAITAITADEIEQRGFTSSSDIAYSVPNASFRPAQQAFGNTQTAYIRGIGQYDFNFAFEPGVGIYVDDVYYPTTMASQFDLLDLERVEVLRGPQGTLFGRGAIGGAVRYVSKQPKGDNTGFVDATVGDYHRVDIRAGYDFAMIPDKLFARVTAVSKKQDGYQNIIDFACAFPALSGTLPPTSKNRLSGCKTGTLGGTDVAGARAQFRFVVNDNVDIGLALDYQRDDSEARADQLIAIAPLAPGFQTWSNGMVAKYGVPYDSRFLSHNPFVTYDTFSDPYSGLSFPPRTSINQKGASATLNWKLSDTVNAKVITAWRNWNGSFSTDQDGSPLGLSVVDGLVHFTYRTAEVQLSGRAMNKLDWTVGGFYYLGNSSSAQQVELPGVLPPFLVTLLYLNNPVQNALLVNGLDNGRFQNSSGFVHGVYSLTDAAHLTLGARYSNDKKHDRNDNTIVAQVVDSSKGRFDWRVGLDYQFNPSMMIYTSASTGYRPPGFNPRPFQTSQFVPVDGEVATAYEIGLKSDFFDRKLRANIAAFYTDYKKRIIPAGGVECTKNPDGSIIPGPLPNPEGGPTCQSNTTPLTAYLNAPGKIKGGELELQFRPIDALLISGSAGYTKTTSDTVVFEGKGFNGITASGEFSEVPEWTGSASVEYTINLTNGATIRPRFDAYLTSEICAFAPNAATGYTGLLSCAGGYTLSNARIEYAHQDREWTVALGANNVTDKRYILNTFDVTGFGEPTAEVQPAQPRTWFLQATRKFGGSK